MVFRSSCHFEETDQLGETVLFESRILKVALEFGQGHIEIAERSSDGADPFELGRVSLPNL